MVLRFPDGEVSLRELIIFTERNDANLHISQQPDIRSNFMRRCSERSQWSQHIYIDLSRIRLRRDWIRIFESTEFGHKLVQFDDLRDEFGPEDTTMKKVNQPFRDSRQRVLRNSLVFRWFLSHP